MGQSAWTITTSRGQRFNVGLYHGEDSGHLVVHCNNAITLIDFGVQATKDYTFFIEEDLCELKIERQGDTYHYHFSLDKDADTPLNRKRKENSRTERNLVLRGVAGVLVAVVLMISFSNFSKAPDPETRAEFIEVLANSRGYPQTEVRFYESEQSGGLRYSYRVADRIYEGSFAEEYLPVFPIRAGDAFEIRYLYDQPDVFYIDFGIPKAETLQQYAALTHIQHAAAHPELSDRQVKCQVELAYELHQFAGLATLYHQDRIKEWAHPYHKKTYLRLIRSPEFSQRARECL